MSHENQETDVVERPSSEESPSPSEERKKSSKSLQHRPQPVYDDEDSEMDDFVAPKPRKNRRMIPIHQSRIADRPEKKGADDSSLKIKIELDLEVEVDLYARVKGDITIGLLTE